jgi:methionyl-tRNA formyltransferase
MRIVFFGTPDWAVPALAAVAATRHVVSLVVSQPTRRRGRGGAVTASPVAAAAARAKIPVLEPTTVKTPQFLSRLAQERPDVLIVVAYGRIFPKDVLELPPYGAVNIHFSLLPLYRGAAPVQWAIANGDTETGVTVMKMTEEMDAGPILAQARVPIEEGEHTPALGARLAPIGAELLASLLEDIDEQRTVPQPQDPGAVTMAPLLRAEDGWVDWTLPAAAIERRIRAFDPWPGQAATSVKGKLHILEARGRAAAEDDAAGPTAPGAAADKPGAAVGGAPPEPGLILGTRGEALEIACGEGTVLEAVRIQPEGRRAILGAEVIRGRYLRAGDRFTAPPPGH